MLINRYSPSGQGVDHAISEFCVLPGSRRRRVGTAAVEAALSAYPGQWELQVHHVNTLGMGFWPRALAAARVEAWEQIEREDRVIHRFRVT